MERSDTANVLLSTGLLEQSTSARFGLVCLAKKLIRPVGPPTCFSVLCSEYGLLQIHGTQEL